MQAVAANTAAVISRPPDLERQPRVLSAAEQRVHGWIRANHGVLSKIAREMGLSVQFVQRIAYNREARSKGLKVERRLLSMGCPLIQKLR